MALALTQPGQGTVLDLHGGLEDLAASLIRVLHRASFIDDPTRLLRAIRYEQRLGFELEEQTRKLLAEAVGEGALSSLSGDRIRNELHLAMSEPHPQPLLLRLGELSLLDSVFSGLGKGCYVAQVEAAEDDPLVYLGALAYPLSTAAGEGFIGRLNMPRAWARVVRDTIYLRSQERKLGRPSARPSVLTQLLEGHHQASIRAVALVSPSPGVSGSLGQYLDRWRYIRPLLTGKDLAQLGVPSGPLIGELLAKLRRARLDGKVANRQEELAHARRFLEAAGEGGTQHG